MHAARSQCVLVDCRACSCQRLSPTGLDDTRFMMVSADSRLELSNGSESCDQQVFTASPAFGGGEILQTAVAHEASHIDCSTCGTDTSMVLPVDVDDVMIARSQCFLVDCGTRKALQDAEKQEASGVDRSTRVVQPTMVLPVVVHDAMQALSSKTSEIEHFQELFSKQGECITQLETAHHLTPAKCIMSTLESASIPEEVRLSMIPVRARETAEASSISVTAPIADGGSASMASSPLSGIVESGFLSARRTYDGRVEELPRVSLPRLLGAKDEVGKQRLVVKKHKTDVGVEEDPCRKPLDNSRVSAGQTRSLPRDESENMSSQYGTDELYPRTRRSMAPHAWPRLTRTSGHSQQIENVNISPIRVGRRVSNHVTFPGHSPVVRIASPLRMHSRTVLAETTSARQSSPFVRGVSPILSCANSTSPRPVRVAVSSPIRIRLLEQSTVLPSGVARQDTTRTALLFTSPALQRSSRAVAAAEAAMMRQRQRQDALRSSLCNIPPAKAVN